MKRLFFKSSFIVAIASAVILFFSIESLARNSKSHVEHVVDEFKAMYSGNPEFAFKNLTTHLSYRPGTLSKWTTADTGSQLIYQSNVLSRLIHSMFFKVSVSKSDKVRLINMALNQVYTFPQYYRDLIEILAGLGTLDSLAALNSQIHGLHSRTFIDIADTAFYQNYMQRVHGPQVNNLWGFVHRQVRNVNRPIPVKAEIVFVFDEVIYSKYKGDINLLVQAIGKKPTPFVVSFLFDYVEPKLESQGSHNLTAANLGLYLDITQKYRTRSRCEVAL